MDWQRGIGSIAALAVLASCGLSGGSSGSGETAEDVDADLLGRQFATRGVAGTTARLSFDAHTITANAGCNTLSGRARTDSGRLFVDSVGGTEIGCMPSLRRQDAWWAELLASDPTYTLDGASLQLETENESVELTDVEETGPDRSLAGTRWVLETLATGGQDGVASSMPGLSARTFWLRFGNGASTQVTGPTGCSSVRTTVAVTESSLRLDSIPLGSVCSEADVQWLSDQVLHVLDGLVDYRIDGDVLTLTRGGRSLTYRAASGR
jgi:heat shock protein HslJ